MSQFYDLNIQGSEVQLRLDLASHNVLAFDGILEVPVVASDALITEAGTYQIVYAPNGGRGEMLLSMGGVYYRHFKLQSEGKTVLDSSWYNTDGQIRRDRLFLNGAARDIYAYAAGAFGKVERDGVDGTTPHIDPDTRHWMIGDVDTGILARGTDGESAYQTAVKEGYQGTPSEWIASLHGLNGKSAYELWVEQPGNEGKSVSEFLASLKESGYKMQAVTVRPSTIAGIEADKIYMYPDGTGQFSTAIYTGDLESSYDSTKWVVLATNPGDLSGAFADINGLRIDVNNLGALVGYYTCNTAATTAAKTVQATGYVLTNGGNIRIKMEHANTAVSNITLQIGNATAKELYYNGEAVSDENTWEDGEVITVYYDGESYIATSTDTVIKRAVTFQNTGIISASGIVDASKTSFMFSSPISLEKGETITATLRIGTSAAAIAIYNGNNSYSPVVIGSNSASDVRYSFKAETQCDVVFSCNKDYVPDTVLITKESTDYKLSKLSEKIEDVKDNVLGVIDEDNVSFPNDGYIGTNGTVNSLNIYKYSDPVFLVAGDKVIIELKIGTSASAIAIKSGNTYTNVVTGADGTNVQQYVYTALDDCDVVFSCNNNNLPSIVQIKKSDGIADDVAYLKQRMEEVGEIIGGGITQVTPQFTNNGIITKNGGIDTSVAALYKYSEPIQLDKNEIIIATLRIGTSAAAIAIKLSDTSYDPVVVGTNSQSDVVYTYKADGECEVVLSCNNGSLPSSVSVKIATLDERVTELEENGGGGGGSTSNHYLNGKVISILGDSISTFGTPDINNTDGEWTYPGNRCRYPDNTLFTNLNATYWKKLIDKYGMTLGVNESWAGSMVSNTSAVNVNDVGPDRCISSQTRIGHLDDNGTPDIILVYAGTNDIGLNATLGEFNVESPAGYTDTQISELSVTTFADAYRAMLIRLLKTYPLARVVVVLPNFTRSYYNPTKADEYIEIVKTACDYFGVQYVDARTAGITMFNNSTYLADGTHPGVAGMDLLFKLLCSKVFEDFDRFGI